MIADSPAGQLSDIQIDNVVRFYRQMMPRFEDASRHVENRLRRGLRADAIRALLSSRAKHPEDVREKIQRKRSDHRYTNDNLIMNLNHAITDLAGARVIVYDPSDEDRVGAIVRSQFDLAPVPGNYEVKRGGNYRATHLLVVLDDGVERESIRDTIIEVQVVSLAAHLFNEVEHDIRYKSHGVEPTNDVQDCLNDVCHAVRGLETMVERLLRIRRQSREDAERILQDAEQLRYTLERAAGRPLRGDFARLFGLLGATLQSLTPASIQALGSMEALLAMGAAGGADPQDDDVVILVRGLMATSDFARDFANLARSWLGPTTPLKRAILTSTKVE